jgi:hypothetical protein
LGILNIVAIYEYCDGIVAALWIFFVEIYVREKRLSVLISYVFEEAQVTDIHTVTIAYAKE